MLTVYLARAKFFFIAFIVVWMVIVLAAVKYSALETQASLIERQANYMKYKLQYNQSFEELSLASVGSLFSTVFQDPEKIASATSSTSVAFGVPVLVYHGIVDDADRFSLTHDTFRDHMFALKRAGYEAVRLSDFIAHVQGVRSLPEKSFLLTFDDGRVDSYQGADPVLKALGWSAVMFVATEQSFTNNDSNYYLDERQVRDMIDSGRWDIESHAAQPLGGEVVINPAGDEGNLLSNKRWLADEDRLETDDEYRARVLGELTDSKRRIQELFGRSVTAFAYPFGDYGHQTINAVEIAEDTVRSAVAANYEVAFRQTWPQDNYFTFNYTDEDVHRLKRIEPPSNWSGGELLAYLESAAPKSLPYADPLSTNNGWKNTWGNLSFSEAGLQLSPTPENTGSFAFLDGTRKWTDYLYTVRAEHDQESYITLYARYQSSDNYVSCTFGNDLVRIDERAEGAERVIAESANPVSMPVGAYYGIRVEADTVSCYEGQAIVARASGISEKLSDGGIGFRIWNETPDQGSLTLSDLRVADPANSSALIDLLPTYR